MSDRTPSAGEKFGVLGRRTIRRAQPGSKATSDHVGLWDLNVKPGSTAHRLEDVYLKALGAVDQAEARKAAALQSGKYTPDGAKADTLQFAAQSLAPVLHRGRQQIASAKREAAELRSKIKLEPADKTDLAGAMRRTELRDWLRSKPQAERDSYIRENAGSMSPEIALAMMEMPAEVSGISTVQRDALIDRAWKLSTPAQFRKFKAEVPLNDFNAIAEPYEARAAAPWLKKFVEGGVEVVRVLEVKGKDGYWRTPSPEQLEIGILAETHDQYTQLKAGDQT